MPTQLQVLPRDLKSIRSLLVTASLLCVSAANAAPPPDLDARANAMIKQYGVPGMAIAIVEDGKTVVARGYGVRRLGSAEPVDADTIFSIGSTTKAMTSAALALLVDEGRIGWDDKVIDHLPGFQMYDPWVTREITIRDLLVHRSGLGLGAGDLLFVPRSSRSRADTVRALRYIKPATSFRSGYAYDNVLYSVAGQLIESVTGQTWEAFVRQRLFKPAGMSVSTTDDQTHFSTNNRAQPHARLNGAFRGLGDQEVLDERDVLGANAAPAGGVATSAADFGRWVGLQLAHGGLPGDALGKRRLYSEASALEMWTPQVTMPIAPYPAPVSDATPQFSSYALGWDVRDYRGARILEHGGAVLGSKSLVVLIPDKHVGFSLQINSEDGLVVRGLANELLDHYLGAPKRDWVSDFATFKRASLAAGLAALQAGKIARHPSAPSLPLARYAGNYADAWYGPIVIKPSDKGLRIDFKQTPNMAGTLEHWQYETFIVRWDDRTIEPAYATFALDAAGAIERMTMKPVSPLADFSYDYQDLLFVPVNPK